MRYTNLLFTYLLTYLLTKQTPILTRKFKQNVFAPRQTVIICFPELESYTEDLLGEVD